MKRRALIAGLGSAAAWPVVARGQQAAIPVVGYVSVGYPDSFPVLPVALRKGLSELGFVEGQKRSRRAPLRGNP
jgi:putative ABC transport system substrate-binding protein